ncbi:hypothetical protein D9611_008560 [Ephemerocybe angulata]|uniref:F-box domain-containing protein n=1 Tax=Ephemerocybe angulata TaxID=980116 RepID=A0A8H5AYY6_9AGAR|nr:hypothetical protein D9611_008560 [Tulosesus angulatus]
MSSPTEAHLLPKATQGFIFPDEIWKECFQGASKIELKFLCVVCRRFAAIFQPLLFRSFDFMLLDDLYLPYDNSNGAIDEKIIEYFSTSIHSFSFSRTTWQSCMARYVRARGRFSLVANDRRLAAFVNKSSVYSSHSKVCKIRPSDSSPSSLGTAFVKIQELTIQAVQDALVNFIKLRQLKLGYVLLTPDILRAIEQLPRLQRLSFLCCHIPGAPRSFNPSAQLSSLESSMCDGEIYAKNIDNLWATWMALLIPKGIRTLSFTAPANRYLNLPQLSIFPALRDVGLLPSLIDLTLPLPSSDIEAKALVAILENCPALQSLTIGTHGDCREDPRSERWWFDLPSASSSMAPLLHSLRAPIEWAELLVPGRPIKSLKVKRNMNVVEDENAPMDILRAFTGSSAPLEELSLPSLGPDFLVLSVIGEFFPRLKRLDLVMPDIGIYNAPTPPPTHSNEPDNTGEGPIATVPATEAPTPEIQFPQINVFVEPPLGLIFDELKRIVSDVAEDLAMGPPNSLYKPSRRRREEGPLTEIDQFWNDVRTRWPPVLFVAECPEDAPEEVQASLHSLAGSIYHAATHPDEWPLPSTLEELSLVQEPPQEGEPTPFYVHQQKKVIHMLSEICPDLRIVTWHHDLHRAIPRWIFYEGGWKLGMAIDGWDRTVLSR